MREFLQRLLQSGYVGMIEAELVRLRAENRALTNSLLGTAGFPPVEYPAEALKPAPIPRARRRSWPQLQAWRENASRHEAISPPEGSNSSARPIFEP